MNGSDAAWLAIGWLRSEPGSPETVAELADRDHHEQLHEPVASFRLAPEEEGGDAVAEQPAEELRHGTATAQQPASVAEAAQQSPEQSDYEEEKVAHVGAPSDPLCWC